MRSRRTQSRGVFVRFCEEELVSNASPWLFLVYWACVMTPTPAGLAAGLKLSRSIRKSGVSKHRAILRLSLDDHQPSECVYHDGRGR